MCELTSSIKQIHYTRTTWFCLHLRKSFSIKDRRTLSPKTMHLVCCFHLCGCVLSWPVVVRSDSEFVSLVLCILPPRFRSASYHRQLRIQTHHTGRWLTSEKFWCKVDVYWLNKLFWSIRTGHILQPRKCLEICKRQWAITPHQRSMTGFAGNKLASFTSWFPYFLETQCPYFDKYGAHL